MQLNGAQGRPVAGHWSPNVTSRLFPQALVAAWKSVKALGRHWLFKIVVFGDVTAACRAVESRDPMTDARLWQSSGCFQMPKCFMVAAWPPHRKRANKLLKAFQTYARLHGFDVN